MPNSTRASTSSNTVWAKRGKWQSRWSRRRRQNRLNVRHERVLILLGLDRHRRQVSERREAAMSQRGETAHKHPRAKTLSGIARLDWRYPELTPLGVGHFFWWALPGRAAAAPTGAATLSALRGGHALPQRIPPQSPMRSTRRSRQPAPPLELPPWNGPKWRRPARPAHTLACVRFAFSHELQSHNLANLSPKERPAHRNAVGT